MTNAAIIENDPQFYQENMREAEGDMRVENKAAASQKTPLQKLAWVVRHLGIVAVVLSAIIFMLQGINDVGALFRDWTWLVLITAMSASGVICRNVLDNSISARILFSLAVALVPVQFSQLGGMVLEYFPLDGMTESIQSLSVLSPLWLSLDIAVSAVLAFVLGYSAFAILVRRSSKLLATCFTLASLSMLLPVRDDLMAWGLLSSLLIAFLVLEFWVFSRHIEFKTTQSFVLRIILSLPLAIMLVRNSLHFENSENIYLLVGLCSLLINYGFANALRGTQWRDYVLLFGSGLAIFTWFQFSFLADIDSFLLVGMVPVIIIAELARHGDRWSNAYTKLASISAVFVVSVACLVGVNLIESVALVLVSAASIAFGVLYQRYMPLISGVVMALISLSVLIAEAVGAVSVNIWLALALGGAALVLGSAAIEKYASQFSSTWDTLKTYK